MEKEKIENYIIIAQIVNVNGLKGNIKINSFTDNMRRFEELEFVYIKDNKQELIKYNIEEVVYTKNNVVLKLKGIDSIEQAEKLKNQYLYIDKKDRQKLEEDEYYISDIISCLVYKDEEYIGKVEDVISTGGNDVYVIKTDKAKQVLIPAISSVIKSIDIKNKKIDINLIEGLEIL